MNQPKHNCKATEIEDVNIKYVSLERGKYLIKGELFDIKSNGEKVAVDNFEDICRVSETSVISHYVCGDQIKSKEDYISELTTLERERRLDQDIPWKSLQDEFNHRKFTMMWSPVHKIEQTISEPLKFPLEKRILESGNPYISSEFKMGIDSDLFIYNQHSAWVGIVREVFKELGMSYSENNSTEETAKNKIWTNSTHSCIEYVKAFGKYLFTKKYSTPSNVKGSLEKCLMNYKLDRDNIREIIKDAYYEKFGSVDESNFDFRSLLSSLKAAQNRLSYTDFKKAGESNYYSINKSLTEAIKQIQKAFEI